MQLSLEERQATWQHLLDLIEMYQTSRPVDVAVRSRVREAFANIPFRDAFISTLGHGMVESGTIQRILADMLYDHAEDDHTPAVQTLLAASLYLDGATDSAKFHVDAVLTHHAYSLANLLSNGLMMDAPPEMLRRSFAHFSPMDLLEDKR